MKRLLAPSSRYAEGFTLLEMLAAISIVAILSAILFGAFNQASKAWLLTENRVETFVQARAALDLFARDISQAVLRTNSDPQPLILQGGADWIAFPAAANDGLPDILTITYQMNTESNGLCSLRRTATNTFTVGTGNNWKLTADANGGDVLVDNVVDVSFQYATIVASNQTWSSALPGGNQNPVSVRLSLTIVDSRAAARLAKANAASGSAVFNNITNSAARTFSLDVYLPSH